KIERLLIIFCQLSLLFLIIASWELVTSGNKLNAFLFGSPSAIWGHFIKMVQDGSLLIDSMTTGGETLLGFGMGNLIGTVIGLLLWYSRFISKILEPYIIAIGSIPIVALAPIAIIWFGTGLASKVAMSTLSVVVVALVIAYKGAMNVDEDQINLMDSISQMLQARPC
uniref:ABC transporter permease n=1 Tax=Polynucleobacter sp. TaxID=2029855 RepID=UPI0040484551